MASLTDAGLSIDTVDEIRTAINERLRKKFGPSLDLSDESIEGQLVGILSERLGNNEELLEVLYDSMNPDHARGFLQDAICAITGTERLPASQTAGVVFLTGDPATSVISGQQVSTGSTDFHFITQGDATMGSTLDSWAETTGYDVGDFVTNMGYVFECITAGTSTTGDGPQGDDADPEDITDGTAHWQLYGEGTAISEAVEVLCNITGTNAAPARSVTTIETPLSGWLGVINIEAMSTGRDVQTDEELALLREIELAQPGTSPIPAITAALINVPGVTSVRVFYNNQEVTDGDGVPPKSVEALVQGGDDQAILECLFANVAGGIGYHSSGGGAVVGTVVDSEGEEHTIEFTRPTEVAIYIAITLTKDAEEYPDDGDDQVVSAVVNYGNAQRPGRDAVASALQSRCFRLPSVLKVVSFFIGTAPTPVSSSDVVITTRQVATYAIGRTSISSSDGTP